MAAVEEDAMGTAKGRSGGASATGSFVGLCKRETGHLAPKSFARSLWASVDTVRSLAIEKKLQKHRGCVNTLHFNHDGSLLLSGSDDRMLMLWQWDVGLVKSSFHSGHKDNVLHALFMPYSNDRSIVSCGADGEVRHSQLSESGKAVTMLLDRRQGQRHQMAVEPGSPHVFHSCGEDGTLLRFDLRVKESTDLFICTSLDYGLGSYAIPLTSVAINPRNPFCFAVAGCDQYARVYDIRKWKKNGSTDIGTPADIFCPRHLLDGDDDDQITCVTFSETNELLVSYAGDDIYLFLMNQGLVSKDADVYADETSCSSSSPQVFSGHQNMETVKGVSLLGPNCEYVASGSDDGRVFIWRKSNCELVRAMKGDRHIVNCIEQHPLTSVIATSGIDDSIKIWSPCKLDTSSAVTKEIEMANWRMDTDDNSETDLRDVSMSDFDISDSSSTNDSHLNGADDTDDCNSGGDEELDAEYEDLFDS